MAKEYYSLEEAADVLGINVSDVQDMVRDGRLAAFDSDGKTVFKIEDVERIVAKEGSSIVDLAITENEPKAAEPVELSVPEPTSDINLLGLDESSIDLDLGPSPVIEPTPPKPPARAPAAPAAKGAVPEADLIPAGESSTIALADSSELDIGLSASDVIALDEAIEKPPGRSAAGLKGDSGAGKAGSKAGTKAGTSISVFDEADLHGEADPLAKTQIAPVAEEELQMASVGSGSGLLDLTRESDDTSLGAELLDVISPSEGSETETAAEPIESDTGTLEAEAVETSSAGEYETVTDESAGPMIAVPTMPVGEAAYDPLSPAFTGLAVVALATLLVAGLAATSQIQGVWPGFMRLIDSGMNLYIFAGGTIVLAGAAWLIGWMIGKPSAPKRPKPAKAKKGAKPAAA